MKYCICAIIKDERRYLEEWIVHNLSIGFDAIHLYEDYGSESHKDITGKYDEVFLHSYNEVEISDYSERDKKQIDLFNYFIKTYRNQYDWCAFIDPDEYIRFEEGLNLERLCQEFVDINGIMLQQKTYGANGHIKRPKGRLQENYTEWTEYHKPKFNMKTIVNLKKDIQFKGVHRVQGALFTNHFGKLEQSICYDKAWYDHYYTKSWEDWCDRFNRGDVINNNVCGIDFFIYNSELKDTLFKEILKCHKGLNIGCCKNLINGWLNTDINIKYGAIYLDATKEFPFTDSSTKFVFCEHMFEHLTQIEGLNMLKNVYRILFKDGVFRIALPLYENVINCSKTKDYLEWWFLKYRPNDSNKCASNYIQQFGKMFGHKTIYKKSQLIDLFKQAGFSKIEEINIGKSSYKELQEIERHSNFIGERFNLLETTVFELCK